MNAFLFTVSTAVSRNYVDLLYRFNVKKKKNKCIYTLCTLNILYSFTSALQRKEPPNNS